MASSVLLDKIILRNISAMTTPTSFHKEEEHVTAGSALIVVVICGRVGMENRRERAIGLLRDSAWHH